MDDKRRLVHWRAVQRCTKIAQSWCDLSNQTRDLEQAYYARVRAESKKAWSRWVLTRRFDPKSDSKNQRERVLVHWLHFCEVGQFVVYENTLNVFFKSIIIFSVYIL